MTRLEMPIIHLNGTSPKSLADDYEKALRAILKAQDALDETAPNGRDYYPGGDWAFERATKQHRERVDVLARLHDDIAAIYEHILDVSGL